MTIPVTREMIERNLETQGLSLPHGSPGSKGSYRAVRIESDVVYTSALGPFSLDGKEEFTHVGQVGRDLDTEAAGAAAAATAVNLIAAVDESVGFESVANIIELIVYIWARTGFEEHAAVADGASHVLHTAIGPEAGAHVRTVIGVHTLPFGLPVVASMKVRLRGETQ